MEKGGSLPKFEKEDDLLYFIKKMGGIE